MELIILASGRGKRLSSVSAKPKCFVKVFEKSLIDHLSVNFKKFRRIFIVVGHKSFLFKNVKFENLKIINNKSYKSSNMVQSLYCVKKFIKEDIIVAYSDIIFDPKIIDQLKSQKTSSLALKKNWLSTWKKRMNMNKILKDAEAIQLSKNKILSIGEKIKTLPKAQYMGLIKFKKKDYKLSMEFYKKLKNPKIDMTSFLNLLLKNKIVSLGYFLTKRFWYEIDTPKDLVSLKRLKASLKW